MAEDLMFTLLVWIMSVMYAILVSVYLEHWEISVIVGKLMCQFPNYSLNHHIWQLKIKENLHVWRSFMKS